jgi:hypothetical protein
MTIEQTITIPKATKQLTVDLPQPVPEGTATFRLEWADAHPKSKKELAAEAIEALCGLYAGVDTLDAYMERHHAENEYEEEIEERAQDMREQTI